MNTYFRFKNGEWGVRIEGSRPIPGHEYKIETKLGKINFEIINEILWTGHDLMHFYCSISKQKRFRF